jgi:hypothetical protein
MAAIPPPLPLLTAVLALAVALSSPGAAAVERSAVPGSCAGLADTERLACFDALRPCADVAAPADRLRCYDRARRAWWTAQERSPVAGSPSSGAGASAPRAGDGRPPVPTPPVPKAPTPAEDARDVDAPPVASDDFGLEQREERAEERLEATIAEVQRDRSGHHYLRLDNGQIWRENTPGRLRYQVGDRVTIERGALGSFDLRLEGARRSAKVRRLQ